ncbi:MAG: type III secretion system export apparatus subunit SctT [Burkholderiaceae bacterium]
MEALDFGSLAGWFNKLLAVTPRALVATLLIPVFAPKVVPATVRTGVALAIASVAILGAGEVEPFREIGGALLAFLILKECAIGLMIGLSFGMVFWAARSIGELIDYQIALTFSQTADPVNGQQVSVTASLMEKLLLTYLVASGGLLLFADTLLLSYQLWPIGEFVPDLLSRATPLLVLETARLLSLALLLAGPVMLAAFMIDVGFGILGRAAPQLNLLALTLPIKMPVALFILILALPFLLSNLFDAYTTVARALRAVMGG